jgi:FkbM family methyltransferase
MQEIITAFEHPIQVLRILRHPRGSLSQPVEVRLKNGPRFKVNSALEVWVIAETWVHNDYLREVGQVLPDWTVVDIGAGIGEFTVLAARLCPAGQVYAFEPLARSFELLKENLAINGITNVQALNLAVSSESRMLSRVEARMDSVSTRYSGNSDGDGGDKARTESVQALPLEAIVERLPGHWCDLLKVDCEGCEYDLLLGSHRDVLNRIGRISMEYHEFDRRVGDLMPALEAAGFTVRLRANPVHANIGFLYAERHGLKGQLS